MIKKKVTIVREHPRKVSISKKNPTGVTIVDQHPRRLPGTFIDPQELHVIYKNYNRKKLKYPKSKKLEYEDSDKYDELIAVWTDYFNKKFSLQTPIDPDIIKALIGSESGFRIDPKENATAFGIAQITKQTFKTLQDPKGEAKDFIFSKFIQKDLKNPEVAILMAVRWLFRKKEMATKKLKKEPSVEEIILEYKGLLRSKTLFKEKALDRFRKDYDQLKK
jgi:hypothetical protein